MPLMPLTPALLGASSKVSILLNTNAPLSVALLVECLFKGRVGLN